MEHKVQCGQAYQQKITASLEASAVLRRGEAAVVVLQLCRGLRFRR